MFKLRRRRTEPGAEFPSHDPPAYGDILRGNSPPRCLVKAELALYYDQPKTFTATDCFAGNPLLNCDLLTIESSGDLSAEGDWKLVSTYRVKAHNLPPVGLIEDRRGSLGSTKCRFIDITTVAGDVVVRVVQIDDASPLVCLGRNKRGIIGSISPRGESYSLEMIKNREYHEFARVSMTTTKHQWAVAMVDADGYRGPSVANIGCYAPGDCVVNTARMLYRFRAIILAFVGWRLGLMTTATKLLLPPTVPTLGWERDEVAGERISTDVTSEFATVTPGEIYDYFHLDTPMITSPQLKVFELNHRLWCPTATSAWTVLIQYGIVDGTGTPLGYMAQRDHGHQLLHDYHDHDGRLVMRVIVEAPTSRIYLPVVTGYGDHKFECVGSLFEEPDGQRRYLLTYENEVYATGTPSVVLAKPFKCIRPKEYGRIGVSCAVNGGRRSHAFIFNGQLPELRAAVVASVMLMDYLKRTRLKRQLLA